MNHELRSPNTVGGLHFLDEAKFITLVFQWVAVLRGRVYAVKAMIKNLLSRPSPGNLGLEISGFGIVAAYLKPEAGADRRKAEVKQFEGSLQANREAIADWLDDLDLSQVRTQIVLHPSLYSVFFVDRPDVEEHELSEAVRWKIKDLVDEPLKDLVVDAFSVPEDAYRGKQRKAYAVAIGKEFLVEMLDELKRLPILVKGVSISELADRSMLQRFHGEPGGAALLRLRSAKGTLNLIDAGDLYLTRSIDSSVSSLESATEENRQAVSDELLLEVQRCLDFYESQLGKGAIRLMLVAPTRLSQNFFDEHLRNHLGLTVQQLDLNECFEFPEPISGDAQSICFSAIAAASDRGLYEVQAA